MTENLKRFRIEFTVDVHHEGVTKDWDWSNEEIKHSAIQELTCMVPYPEDITFSEANPWHTGTPTEEGWYLVAFNYEFEEGVRYTTDYFKDGKWAFPMVRDISKIVAWQKIEPYKEKEDG